MTAEIIGRRAELLARVFLEDLQPSFLASVETVDVPFDFLAGFLSSDGILMVAAAIEVKGASSVEENRRFPLHRSQRQLKLFRQSNLPLLYLIVDVKMNRFFYAWSDFLPDSRIANRIAIRLTPASSGSEGSNNLPFKNYGVEPGVLMGNLCRRSIPRFEGSRFRSNRPLGDWRCQCTPGTPGIRFFAARHRSCEDASVYASSRLPGPFQIPIKAKRPPPWFLDGVQRS